MSGARNRPAGRCETQNRTAPGSAVRAAIRYRTTARMRQVCSWPDRDVLQDPALAAHQEILGDPARPAIAGAPRVLSAAARFQLPKDRPQQPTGFDRVPACRADRAGAPEITEPDRRRFRGDGEPVRHPPNSVARNCSVCWQPRARYDFDAMQFHPFQRRRFSTKPVACVIGQ